MSNPYQKKKRDRRVRSQAQAVKVAERRLTRLCGPECPECEEREDSCECGEVCDTCDNTGFVESSCRCDGRLSCPICRGATGGPCGDCHRGDDEIQSREDALAEDYWEAREDDRRYG